MTAPLVPSEVDLRDFPFTPIFRARLFGSRFHARVSDAGWRAGVTLWLKSWDQVPAGSLPGDDIDLCRLAELGRDLKSWRKIRGEALHGWFPCADGRLYHKVVAQGVCEAWDRKCAQRSRTAAARAARAAKRTSRPDCVPPDDDGEGAALFVTEGDSFCHGQGESADSASRDRDRDRDRKERESESAPSCGGGKKDARRTVAPTMRGTRLSLNWTPSAKAADFAAKLGLDAGATVERFRDYWIAQPGSRGVKLDWDATWRNWCRTEAERGPRPAAKTSSSGPVLQGEAEWELKVRLFDPEKPWSWGAMSGPRPDQPGCYAPRSVLEKHGWAAQGEPSGAKAEGERA
ncbi:MAG: hypothetical protein RBR34_12170 [Rhodospirillaceae bacterium]|nr:hypothetical protein [Rhodospirillaceae bacterium]